MFLSSERPEVVSSLSTHCCYQRKFGFQNATAPPGLWSRLLSRLINTVNVVTELLDHSNKKDRGLLYWKKGLCCQSSDILFIIESCRLQGEDDGISIVYSSKVVQQGLLGQLVNLVQQIVSEWFPGLVEQLEQIFICHECAKENNEITYKLVNLLECITESKSFKCELCKKDIELKTLAPDLLLLDIEVPLLKFESVQIQHNEDLIWMGKFGKVYHGILNPEIPVVVKLYNTDEVSQLKRCEMIFQIFRAELTYLQKLKHPCLVGIKGVCRYPNVALVMEDTPMSSLDSCLLKELRDVPRIVVYRIAAQIASALRFLHSIPIIYCSLTTSKVLVWSLSLDDLVNCKLADLEIVTYGDTGHAESFFVDKLIAPEVSEQAVYDNRIDVYSLGVVIFWMMQRSYPIEYRELLPDLIMKSTNPDSKLHHIGSLAKKCCNDNPADRPDLQEIVEQLCDPVFQLVMDVTTVDANISCACTGCIQHVEASVAASYHTGYNAGAWICNQYGDGSEIVALSLKGVKIETDRWLFIKDHQIITMLSHGDYVWATSMQANHKGSLLKFDGNKKGEYIEVPIKRDATEGGGSLPDGDYGVALVCSDNHVYVGTASGWCLMFPIDFNNDTVPIREISLSSNFIRSLIVVKKTSLLWVSTVLSAGDEIRFVNLTDLEFDQRKGVSIDDYRVGNLLLSPDEETVWTVHINGHSISAWNAQTRELICPFNSHKLLDEKIDQKKSRIASANVVLDTLWVGLVSGHILAVSATLLQRALIIVKPYNQIVQVLVPIYGKDNKNTMMISIGKDYAHEKQSKKQPTLDIVLWEVVNGNRMIQMNYLSTGKAWLNDASLDEVCYTRYIVYNSYCDVCVYYCAGYRKNTGRHWIN